jgi:DMSO/TMAO reductase YedYZ heme-binding membrane subunit
LLLAAAGPSASWYLARGTGVVTLLLLTASVVLGILGTMRFASEPRWPRFAIDSLHRDISLLVIVLLILHVITSVLDSFAPIKLTDALIPFASSYRPLWLGLGALSLDILVALVITSLVRRRLGYRAWRGVHWLAYLSWPVAVLHGLGSGSDAKAWWMLAITAVCVGAVAFVTVLRIARSDSARDGLRGPAIALTIATPLALALFTLAGPLQPGWARRAGTPASLLGKAPTTFAAVASPAGRSAPAAAQTLTAPFTARLSGTASQTQVTGGAIVDLALRLSGGARGRLRVRLAGAPLDGGGLSMTGSQVDLLAVGIPSVMQGQIVSLQGQQFVARVRAGSSPPLDLHATLNIDSNTGQVTGTLAASPAGSGG